MICNYQFFRIILKLINTQYQIYIFHRNDYTSDQYNVSLMSASYYFVTCAECIFRIRYNFICNNWIIIIIFYKIIIIIELPIMKLDPQYTHIFDIW